MRLAALTALAVLVATPVFAAEKVWTDAPVSGVATTGSVAPADRAGHSNGPDNASPFSGLPSGAVTAGSAGGASTSRELDDTALPSLSR